MGERKAYKTDVSDEQWKLIEPHLPPAKHGGRYREVDLREVINTLLYQQRTECQWALLPHDLLPRSTVWDYLEAWKKDGTWQKITTIVRRRARPAAERTSCSDDASCVG